MLRFTDYIRGELGFRKQEKGHFSWQGGVPFWAIITGEEKVVNNSVIFW